MSRMGGGGSGIYGAGMVSREGSRVTRFGFRGSGLGVRVPGLGFRIKGRCRSPRA